MNRSRPPAWLIVVLCALSLSPLAAQAQHLRAWLDRDRIAFGETATLNIETDQVAAPAPDYGPLLGDFRVSGNTSSRSFRSVNGKSTARTLFAVALQPRHAGVIGIAPLQVGNQRTQPLSLTVTPAAATPPSAQAGDAVFIEARADAVQPYVQQAVGYTVRLYSATPLISGQLDQAQPDGASLQRIGEDVQYNREVAGRRYNVIERHYLLIPERSGSLTIPAPRFEGRGVGGFFDDFFSDGQRALRASGPARTLQVRAIPGDAPQPWLPLHDLQLRYVDAPRDARAGEAVTVTVELSADGATAAQLPELQWPPVDGAQVFANPAQSDDSFHDGRPQVRLRRSYSIVPAGPGELTLHGPSLAWWDVDAGSAHQAVLPPLTLHVTGAVAASGASSAAAAATTGNADAANAGGWMHVPGVQGEVRPWAFAAAAFALLWLITLMWGLHRHPHPAATVPKAGGSGKPAAGEGRAAMARLRAALDHGGLDEVADVLCAMATPAAADCDALQHRLNDPAQRAAVAQLQRARWGDGDGVAARAALRNAFAHGPRWQTAPAVVDEPLPPLYPLG